MSGAIIILAVALYCGLRHIADAIKGISND
jgi:hypothetical protein